MHGSGVARIQIFEGFLDLVFQREKACLQFIVTEGLDFRFALVDGDHQRLQFFDVALVLGANKSRDYAVRYLRYVHERACRPDGIRFRHWREVRQIAPEQHFILSV